MSAGTSGKSKKVLYFSKSNADNSQKRTLKVKKKKKNAKKKSSSRFSSCNARFFLHISELLSEFASVLKTTGGRTGWVTHRRAHVGYVSGFASWVWWMSPNGLLIHATCINWHLFVKRRDNKKHRANYQVSSPWCSHRVVSPCVHTD